ncbi:MAG: BPL-N domain-containing protein, partial [Candidatus Sifarchaeia archaeon]
MAARNLTSYKKQIIAVIIVTVFVASAFIVLGTPTGMEDVRVAIYDGGGILPSSKAALDSMFAWMRANVGHVNETSIREGALADYDLLVIPAGGGFEVFLQNEGMDAICQFVEDGGSYFGICGGASFATD